MTVARALAALLVLAAWLPAAATAATRYDPRLRFRTIATARFDIHFHQGEEVQARRLAIIAEEVAAALDRTLGPPRGRVHVILVDQTDLSNGWATPFPNNVVEITAAAPRGQSLIGNTDDWLRLVFTHEYTHVVHLSRGAGWIGGLRRVFGRMPILFPNAFTPLWQIEGIATWQESALTNAGRLRAGDFRLIPEYVAGAAGFLPLDRAGGGLIGWPGGHAQYAYGGLFHEFLARTYGEQSLLQLTDATAGYPPYFGALAFRRVFGRPLGDLWRDFEASARRSEPAAPTDPSRLTRHGFAVGGPRYGRDGTLYYSLVTPHAFPTLMALPPGQTEPRVVSERYLGTQLGFAESRIVFDQVEIVRHVGLQSDLYSIGLDGGGLTRLTKGLRASDPDVSPDGTAIACTIQRADGRGLAILPLTAAAAGPPRALDGAPLTDWSSPRWSPDGRWIAAERRVTGGPSEIVLVEATSGSVRRLVATRRGRTVTPAWSRDGRQVLFSSDRDGVFRIYGVDVETGAVRQLGGTGPFAQSPEVSPHAGSLTFVGYTAEGNDLFSVPADSVAWVEAEFDAPEPSPGSPGRTDDPAGRAYSPVATLLPRFWTPTVESDAGELVVGAATGGYDALGRHAYGIEAGWSTARAMPDWQVAYAYDRWRPTLFLNVSDDTDPWRGGELRSREVNAGVLVPVRRVRWTQSVLGAFHASADSFDCAACEPGVEGRATRGAIRAGWMMDAARTYGYLISEEDGWSAAATLELTRTALGADGNGGAATADLRGYVRLGSAHSVLAARAAAAAAWGDDRVRRTFSASGPGGVGRVFAFGSDAIGLLRGVDSDSLVGARAAVVNLDYRVPLRRIERGIGTLPVFVRTLHGAVFADAGQAWTASLRRRDVVYAVGAETAADTVLGYGLPLTFAGGVAWRAVSGDRDVVLFGRVGRAF